MRRAAAFALVTLLAGAPVADAAAPSVDQMVVFRSGKAVTKKVSARGVLLRVGRRRCASGTGTPLAALARSKAGKLRLRDFGSCSRRARDGAGLFVSAIGRDRNRGSNGWTYKVGRRAATAGAGDPTGPFGTGRRLRSGQRVTWLYCRLAGAGCQRTLELRAAPAPGGVAITVRGYDDDARGVPVEGARVRLGGASQLTDASGAAGFAAAPGRYLAYASKPGLVRSFPERVVVR